MTRQEASQILETARPAGPTHDDPQVAEALRLAARDPELTRQLERQRALDAAVTAGVKTIPVPPLLKDAILGERKIVRPHFWQDWRTATAAAAAIILLLGGAGFFIQQGRAGFADFRQELVADNWAGDPHLDYEAADLEKIRAWLAGRKGTSDFVLPAGLDGLRPHGARVFEHDDQKISLVCLADGARHLHLFVLDRPGFSDLPAEGAPDFEKCGLWKTASWRQGGKTYVLTGMNYQTFVSKFRKGGRWATSG
jgi:hypothetical protein